MQICTNVSKMQSFALLGEFQSLTCRILMVLKLCSAQSAVYRTIFRVHTFLESLCLQIFGHKRTLHMKLRFAQDYV